MIQTSSRQRSNSLCHAHDIPGRLKSVKSRTSFGNCYLDIIRQYAGQVLLFGACYLEFFLITTGTPWQHPNHRYYSLTIPILQSVLPPEWVRASRLYQDPRD